MGQDHWVSPAGKDTAPGTKERPFATLERARDEVRKAKQSGLPQGGITVWLKGGTYELSKTFELNEKDSGTAEARVVYRAVPGAEVRISGGKQLSGRAFTPVTDPAILARLPEEARGKVLQVDLKAQGLTDFGVMRPQGWGRPYANPGLELFINDQPMQLARWPNDGMVPIGEVLDPGLPPGQAKPGEALRGGTFHYDGDRPARWTQAEEVWLCGYFGRGFAEDTIRVKQIDPGKRTITMEQPDRYGLLEGKRVPGFHFALNLLEEIDTPGEWYLDRKTGLLYLWPPSDLKQAKIAVSLLEGPMVAMEGASSVTLRGFTFENSRGMGVYIERGNDNLVAGCTLRNLGTVAVCLGQGIKTDPTGLANHPLQRKADRGEMVKGEPISRELRDYHDGIYADSVWNRQAGTHHGIVGCDIYNTGAGGIVLGGGDRKTLTPAGNYVLNCDLHDYNRWERAYRTGVVIDGVGNRVSHCRFHDAPLMAIYLQGNDHIMEFNEIYHISLPPAEENSVVYMGRNPSELGNIFRYNFVHHVGNPGAGGGTWAVGLDDGACGLIAFGNIFYAAKDYTIGTNGGHDLDVRNNIFVESPCRIGSSMDNAHWFAFMQDPLQVRRLRQEIDVLQPPYSTHYPKLAHIFETAPDYPRGNVIHNNLSVKSGDFGATGADDAGGNWVTDEDPGFVDMAKVNFQLKPDSIVFQKIPGFQPLPFEKIGLYADEYRPKLVRDN